MYTVRSLCRLRPFGKLLHSRLSSVAVVNPLHSRQRVLCTDRFQRWSSSSVKMDSEALNPDHGGNDDQPIPSLKLNSNQQSLSAFQAIVMDATGHHKFKTVERQHLKQTYALASRDLRVLDASFRNLPAILVRDNCILVNFDFQRALITADSFMLFFPFGPNTQQIMVSFKEHVQSLKQENLDMQQQKIPYEFVALEYLLITVCDSLERRYSIFHKQVHTALEQARLTQGQTFSELLPIKYRLASFRIFLKETALALHSVIDSDEDMAGMYLTDFKKTGKKRPLDQHQEMEMLLETYLHKVEEIQNEVKGLMRNIEATEQLITIHLDMTRNQIMRLELMLAIGTFSMASGAFGSSLFGMNLLSHFETSPIAFYAVGGAFVVLAGGIVVGFMRLAKRRQIDLFPKTIVQAAKPKRSSGSLTNMKDNRMGQTQSKAKKESSGTRP